MGSLGNSLIRGIDVDEVIQLLDSLYAFEMVATHYNLAVSNRLEGQATILLEGEFEERASQTFEHANKIAARLSEVGGAITADPTQFVQISPLDRFALPASNSDVGEILSHTLEQVRTGIRAYSKALERVKDTDAITYYELLKVMKDHVRSEDEIEVALMGKFGEVYVGQ
jgi:ferritin-like protein